MPALKEDDNKKSYDPVGSAIVSQLSWAKNVHLHSGEWAERHRDDLEKELLSQKKMLAIIRTLEKFISENPQHFDGDKAKELTNG